jgi:hypothetical protein
MSALFLIVVCRVSTVSVASGSPTGGAGSYMCCADWSRFIHAKFVTFIDFDQQEITWKRSILLAAVVMRSWLWPSEKLEHNWTQNRGRTHSKPKACVAALSFIFPSLD